MTSAPIFYTPKVVGFAPYVPRKEAALIIDRVKEVLLDYAAHLPLTLRQVYYRLISTHADYPKTEKFYDELGRILSRSRRAGLLDWESIRDDGIRSKHCGGGFSGTKHFFRYVASIGDGYRRDKHAYQNRQIILICEAEGMVPQLERAVGDLPVTIQTCGGMDSVTAKYRLAQLCFKENTTILHIGDWDPGGIAIYHGILLDVGAMIRELSLEAGESADFQFRRIGVLPEHVAQYGLLTGTTKSGDADKSWYPGIGGDRTLTCQAEAFPPDILIKMVRTAVEAEIDMVQHQVALHAQLSERNFIQDVLSVANLGEVQS